MAVPLGGISRTSFSSVVQYRREADSMDVFHSTAGAGSETTRQVSVTVATSPLSLWYLDGEHSIRRVSVSPAALEPERSTVA